MNIHIITSSYPAHSDDPTGTAGLFVRQFAIELANSGHKVVVQPAARKEAYQADPGISIIPTPWLGGDQELASMNLINPINWMIFSHFFVQGVRNTLAINAKHSIDRVLCMWAIPSGIFGLAGKISTNLPYDIWVLGSDIWKMRKIPYFGRKILGKVMKSADRVYADGLQLCSDASEITGMPCDFLASSRILPQPQKKLSLSDHPEVKHFLFVGRYHPNKGPDLLVKAVANLPYEIKESIRVHMFGVGPMEKELKNMISEMHLEKYIVFNGPIQAQNLSNYLESVSFLVIPSRIESIPVIFSDALQRETPVVAMPVGDLKGLIKQYNCGIVAEAVSAEALATAIKNAVLKNKDVYRKYTANAYELFELKRSVARWLNIKANTGSVDRGQVKGKS